MISQKKIRMVKYEENSRRLHTTTKFWFGKMKNTKGVIINQPTDRFKKRGKESYGQLHHGKTVQSVTTAIHLVVKPSVITTDNSPCQDCTHPDDQTALLHVTLGFVPITVNQDGTRMALGEDGVN